MSRSFHRIQREISRWDDIEYRYNEMMRFANFFAMGKRSSSENSMDTVDIELFLGEEDPAEFNIAAEYNISNQRSHDQLIIDQVQRLSNDHDMVWISLVVVSVILVLFATVIALLLSYE